MPELDVTLLRPKLSVLVLQDPDGTYELPTPVMYMGLVPMGQAAPMGMASAAFKRQVMDTEGEAHQITDATLSTLYVELDGAERDALKAKHWSS